ncbi:GntR family transcriptional regulator [Oceaniglobus trochenteri]|uniref:GntR family transcriptional regulator n=1 Tax=Oceaniglobus trochenteri TaxID=2763260 RepID=UPI001CFFA7CB|nr:GntR family transcriptional regulator [Oceaniglobus trochenteri]
MSMVSGKRGQRIKTTSAWIVEELRREIVSRRIAAGDRLTVSEIATRYDVSGAPVREAMVQLASEGYIDMQANRGAVARVFGPTELRNIFSVREAFESHQTRRFAAVARPEDLDRLEQLAHEFETLVKTGDARRSSQVNIKFHDVMIRHDGNAEIAAILDRHRGVAMMMRHDFGRSDLRAEQAAQEHFTILAALRAGDADAAAAASGSHVRGTLDDILELYAQAQRNKGVGA